MTSRPATPESETPEVDAVRIDDLGRTIIWTGVAENKLLDLARSLERRLSLAKTEIKGHMMVVDDLKARVAELERALVEHRGDAPRGVFGW